MEIINVDEKRFLVLEKFNFNAFKTEEYKQLFLNDKLHVIQQNTNNGFIVREIQEAEFEDLVQPQTEEKEIEEITSDHLPPEPEPEPMPETETRQENIPTTEESETSK